MEKNYSHHDLKDLRCLVRVEVLAASDEKPDGCVHGLEDAGGELQVVDLRLVPRELCDT